jgi:hypothetical protein
MSRYERLFRFGLALLLAGLIFGGLRVGLALAQVGSAAPQGSCTVPSVCAAGETPRLAGPAAGAAHVRFFPLWYNDTRKTRP